MRKVTPSQRQPSTRTNEQKTLKTNDKTHEGVKNHDIFFQSESSSHPKYPPNRHQKCSVLPQKPKIESEESSFELESSSSDESPISPIRAPKKPREDKTSDPILSANEYKPVLEIDFQLYTTFLAQTKIYGGLLIDDRGSLLWCDKIAHELLEGSLNNFSKATISTLLLSSHLPHFLNQLRSLRKYDSKTTVHWIVYSKNSKRKYKKIPLPKHPSTSDVFYRYLKALTVRIRPVSICLPTYRDEKGFCNESLVPKQQARNCFFLELRLSKRPPNLAVIDILHDPIIQNFVQNHRVKSLEQAEFTKRNQMNEEQIDNQFLLSDGFEMEDENLTSRLIPRPKESSQVKEKVKRRRRVKGEVITVKQKME